MCGGLWLLEHISSTECNHTETNPTYHSQIMAGTSVAVLLYITGFLQACSGMQLSREVLTGQQDPCACKPWAEVYTTQGMNCKPGIGGLAGSEFCNFIKHMNSSVCLQRKFQPPKSVDSFCYVSKECPTSKSLVGEKVNYKTCQTGTDVLLTEMPVAKRSALAQNLGVDQGCMAGYADAYRQELVRDTNKTEIAQIKASGVPTLMWSMKDHLAPRMEIRDGQVWEHKFSDKSPTYWDVSCRDGCA